MATKKKVTRVGGDESIPTQQRTEKTFVPTPENKGKALQSRSIAGILWLLGISAEIGAILVLLKSAKPIETNTWIWLIALIVVDLVLVIIGSQIWKKANRLDPASEKEPVKFFIQNQLGVIISVIAFLPLVILIFTNKDLDGKQKGVIGGIAAIALIIAGVTSADFNPPSVEQYTQQTNRVEELTGVNNVYWTKSGTKYHLYNDCSHINTNRTDEIFEGTVAQARELKNITELCKTCENRAEKTNGSNVTPATTPESLPVEE
ncbi:MAG: hypothetical protein LBS08_05165 [Candidatus Symbiothrix sp.]|jgi:hypothetical protein|nr:hypothetical protein [Candidatus Symbiothrix sp.]